MGDEGESYQRSVASTARVKAPLAWRMMIVALGMIFAATSILGPIASDDTPDSPSMRSETSNLASWKFATIDSEGDVGYDISIALDSNSRVHASYHDRTNGDLKYATNAGGSWACQALDSAGEVGLSTSIALDSNDKVHISYLDWTNGDLKYATNAAGSWEYRTLDSTGDVGLYTSIAIDSIDRVHISYLDYTNNDLKYATNEGGSWICYTLDSEGDVGYDTSIALDSNDRAHISYGDWGNDDLKYATNANGSWAYYTLDSTGYVGYDTSIALDLDDNVYISYHDETNAYLKYATNVSGSWVCYTLDTAGSVGLATSIAVDSASNVHISYCDYSDYPSGNLKYATNIGGSWAYYTLDSTGNVGYDTDIAVDSNHVVHIGYSDYTNHDLKYAFGTEEYVPKLVVTIRVTPAPGPASLTVQFTSDVSGGLEPYAYWWTFGDGGTNSSQNPVYTYAEAGEYTVTLVVIDLMSTSKSDQRTVLVTLGQVVPGPDNDISPVLLQFVVAGVVGLAVILLTVMLLMWRQATATGRVLRTEGSNRPGVLIEHPAEARIQDSRHEQESARRRQVVPSGGPRLIRVEDKLFQLRTMREKGLISEEEYEEKLRDLIRRW